MSRPLPPASRRISDDIRGVISPPIRDSVISTEAFAPANAKRRDPCTSQPSFQPRQLVYALTLLAATLFLSAPHAIAQGCTQCLDSTRATPPAVQAAYRHAIFLLGGVAAALFVGGLLLLRRESRD